MDVLLFRCLRTAYWGEVLFGSSYTFIVKKGFGKARTTSLALGHEFKLWPILINIKQSLRTIILGGYGTSMAISYLKNGTYNKVMQFSNKTLGALTGILRSLSVQLFFNSVYRRSYKLITESVKGDESLWAKCKEIGGFQLNGSARQYSGRTCQEFMMPLQLMYYKNKTKLKFSITTSSRHA